MADIEYLAPRDLEEALKAMEEWKGRAKVIAGGTNLIPYMRAGWVSPELLIDFSGLKDLDFIKREGETLSIGALTTIAEVASSETLRSFSPILPNAAGHLGNPLCRNRATIGGNLANASPGADMAPPLLVLEASVHTERGGESSREIPLDQFFLGPNKTVLEQAEVITQISFPKPKDSATGSQTKFGLRNADALSIVNVAVMIEMEGKLCRKARVALCPLAPTPIRMYRVEETLEGNEITAELLDECGDMLKQEVTPRLVSIRASAEYRKVLSSVLFKRAVREALKGVET